MKNHQQEATRHLTSLQPEQITLAASPERSTPSRNGALEQEKAERKERETQKQFPAGQWANRGENDGLDFFL